MNRSASSHGGSRSPALRRWHVRRWLAPGLSVFVLAATALADSEPALVLKLDFSLPDRHAPQASAPDTLIPEKLAAQSAGTRPFSGDELGFTLDAGLRTLQAGSLEHSRLFPLTRTRGAPGGL